MYRKGRQTWVRQVRLRLEQYVSLGLRNTQGIEEGMMIELEYSEDLHP